MSVADALRAVSEYPVRLMPVERIPVSASPGRVLAGDIIAAEDVPPFDRSSVDGFAVVAASVEAVTSARPAVLNITGEVRMGAGVSKPLGPSEAVRVPTGGALPPGATGVIKLEDVVERNGSIEVRDAADCIDHITMRGVDVAHGDILRRRGDVVTPAAAAMIAGAGIAEVAVFARPAVGLIVTGDELVAPGRPLRAGEIRETNSIALGGCLRAMGMQLQQYPRVPDRKEELERAFRRALEECDAIVVSGGSSVGERDYTPAVVAAAGTPGVIVHGVRAKPGRPVMLGIVGDMPVIGLPGNPVSALVMLETLGKPFLLRLFDKTDATLPVRARLQNRIDVDPALEHLIPVRIANTPDGPEATALFGTSAQMRILGWADALMSVPEGKGVVEAGTWVDAKPLTTGNGLR